MDFEFAWNWNAFVDSLKYMGLGMLGIFLVMGILIGFIVALNRIRFIK